MLEAVLFDLDGLLLDTEPIYVQACNHMGERLGVRDAGHLIPKTIGMNSENSTQFFRRVFGANYDIKKSYEYFHEYINHYIRTRNGMPVKLGARTLLRWLQNRGYKLGIATCKSIGYVQQYLALANVLDCFSVIVGEDAIIRSGESADAFTLACQALEVEPRCTMVIEDAPSGILTASRAGCIPVMVPDLVQPTPKISRLLHAQCDTLFDIIDVIERYEHAHGGPPRVCRR